MSKIAIGALVQRIFRRTTSQPITSRPGVEALVELEQKFPSYLENPVFRDYTGKLGSEPTYDTKKSLYQIVVEGANDTGISDAQYANILNDFAVVKSTFMSKQDQSFDALYGTDTQQRIRQILTYSDKSPNSALDKALKGEYRSTASTSGQFSSYLREGKFKFTPRDGTPSYQGIDNILTRGGLSTSEKSQFAQTLRGKIGNDQFESLFKNENLYTTKERLGTALEESKTSAKDLLASGENGEGWTKLIQALVFKRLV